MEPRALDHLSPPMKDYLARQEIAFVSTSDRGGVCHASYQAGPPGFVRVLDDRTLMYPQYGGGPAVWVEDVAENPHVGLLFADSPRGEFSLHIAGRVRLIEHAAVQAFAPLLRRMSGIEQIDDVIDGQRRTPERWVLVDIAEVRVGSLPNETEPRPRQVAPPVAVARPPAAAHPVDDDELSYLLPPAWEQA